MLLELIDIHLISVVISQAIFKCTRKGGTYKKTVNLFEEIILFNRNHFQFMIDNISPLHQVSEHISPSSCVARLIEVIRRDVESLRRKLQSSIIFINYN